MQNQSNNSALFSNTNSNTSLQDELNENSNSNSNSANDSFNKNNSKKKPVRVSFKLQIKKTTIFLGHVMRQEKQYFFV